jgi:hypothetical protein
MCPSDADLIAAIEARNDARTTEIARKPRGDGTMLLVHFFAPQRVSEVLCGEQMPGEVPTVTCKFVARYPRSDGHNVAKLFKEGGRWKIAEGLELTREVGLEERRTRRLW